MMRELYRRLTLFSRFSRVLPVFLAMFGSAFGADQPSPAEAKLRESLRATMLELRAAQTERANLQATQAELDARNASLTGQVEAMRKQAEKDKGDSEKTIDYLSRKVDERDREIGSLRVSLDKWKADHARITELAVATEGRRAKLVDKVIVLERNVADQRVKNAAMHKLGLEILSRYEKFGLGQALTAREPFVGLTRVKFQNLVQDYGDKLEEQRIKPEANTSTVEPKRTGAAR